MIASLTGLLPREAWFGVMVIAIFVFVMALYLLASDIAKGDSTS